MDPWAPDDGAQHGSRLLAKASRCRQEAGVKGCSATLLESCAPALTAPQSESDYEHLVAVLDKILDAGGADETSPLATLAERIGELVEVYETERHPIPDASPVDVLVFLMNQNGLKLEDLPEIGTRSVASDVLSGKRELDIRQVAKLSKRFGVPTDAFIT